MSTNISFAHTPSLTSSEVRRFMLGAHSSFQETLDLTKVHLPQVQAVLKRLSVPPTPLQYLHDKGLIKNRLTHMMQAHFQLNQLIMHHVSLLQKFMAFIKLQALAHLKHQRRFEANKQFASIQHQYAVAEVIRKQYEKELKASVSQGHELKAALTEEYQVLFIIKMECLELAAGSFLDFVRNQPTVLQGLFSNYSNETVLAFGRISIEKKVKRDLRKDKYQNRIDDIKNAMAQFPEDAPEQEFLMEELKEAERKLKRQEKKALKDLSKAARKCEMSDADCTYIDQNRKAIKPVFDQCLIDNPFIMDLKQAQCALYANKKHQAQLEKELCPLEPFMSKKAEAKPTLTPRFSLRPVCRPW